MVLARRIKYSTTHFEASHPQVYFNLGHMDTLTPGCLTPATFWMVTGSDGSPVGDDLPLQGAGGKFPNVQAL